MEKTCRKCGEAKALEEFYGSKTAKDGRQSRCKECAKAGARQWAKDHPERHLENVRRYGSSDKGKAARKARREGPAREHILEQKRESWARNREENVAKLRNRWAENAGEYNARRRARYLEDPEYRARRKEQQRAWREANRDYLRDKMLRWDFGITVNDFARMLEEQAGLCAICSEDITGLEEVNGLKNRVKAHVDHCHDSGRVRALLCTNCNKSLGLMRDDPARLRAAAAYVERHKV